MPMSLAVRRPIPCLLAGLVLTLTAPAPAATIQYAINGSTNDFVGTIDVDDLAASISAFSNINFITATGYGSEPIGFFGTNANGWVTYLGNNGGQFGFQSPAFRAEFQAGTIWNAVIGNSYTITTSSTSFNTTFSAPASQAPNLVTSQNGVITFSVVPEPATLAMAAFAALGVGAARCRRRRVAR